MMSCKKEIPLILFCDVFISNMVPFQAIFRSFYILWNKDIILKWAEV